MKESSNITKVHFVGIGGESMSALAIYLKQTGVEVSGSDRRNCQNVEKLRKDNIKVNVPHNKNAVIGKDYVIKSYAISEDNEEVEGAEKRGIPILTRGELLGLISKRHKFTIAISGSHGKSTTSAMTSKILLDFGLDPAIHIGANFPYIGGNVRYSESPYFVTEACEYKRAFLSLSPFITVITNMELDHPDCYKTKEELYDAYGKLAKRTSGVTLLSPADKGKLCPKNAMTVGIDKTSYYGAENIVKNENGCEFDLRVGGKVKGRIKLMQRGRMNVENALFALAVSDEIGVPFIDAKRSIESFLGIAKRQECLVDSGIKVYLDYSHHPTQIRNVAECFDKREGRLIGIFQPHTYSRTKAYLDDFAKCFDGFNKVYVLPTYAARESVDENGDSRTLFAAIENTNKELISENEISRRLLADVDEKDTVVFMGAGDVDRLAYDFAEMLTKCVANQKDLC